MERTTLADRLKRALAGPPKVSQVALARACGIKPQSVSDWVKGKTVNIEGKNLLRAARALGVNPEWLSSGKGDWRAQSAAGTFHSQPVTLDPETLSRSLTLLEFLEETRGKLETFARGKELGDIYSSLLASEGRTTEAADKALAIARERREPRGAANERNGKDGNRKR